MNTFLLNILQYIKSMFSDTSIYGLEVIRSKYNVVENIGDFVIPSQVTEYVCYDKNIVSAQDIDHIKANEWAETIKKDCDSCFEVIYVKSEVDLSMVGLKRNFLEIITAEKCDFIKNKLGACCNKYMLILTYFKIFSYSECLLNNDFKLSEGILTHIFEYFGTKVVSTYWYTKKKMIDHSIALRQNMKRQYIDKLFTLTGNVLDQVKYQYGRLQNNIYANPKRIATDDMVKEVYTLFINIIMEFYKFNDEINNTSNSKINGNSFQELYDKGIIRKVMLNDDIISKYLSTDVPPADQDNPPLPNVELLVQNNKPEETFKNDNLTKNDSSLKNDSSTKNDKDSTNDKPNYLIYVGAIIGLLLIVLIIVSHEKYVSNQ